MPACDVLVVDDDAAITTVLRDVLVGEALSVECATSARQALTLLSHGLAPTVMLLDVHMPLMTGLDVLESIRANPRTQDVGVVLMSADHGVAHPAVVAVLQKPFGIDELLQTLWPIVRGEPWTGGRN